MNNTPENEKKEIMENDEAFSTIFSNPEEKKAPIKKRSQKKPLVKIIAAFLALAVLIGGTIAVIKLIPEREEEDNFVPIMDEIEVLNMENTSFSSVSITNQNGRFDFYSEKVSNDSEESAVNWYVKGYDKELISPPAIEEIINGIRVITASRKITEKSFAECGLDKPSIKAEIVMEDGLKRTLSIGAASGDRTGYYFNYSDNEDIYLVSATVRLAFEFEALDFANDDVMPGFPLTESMTGYMDENSDLSSFDSITINGENFKEAVVIAPAPEDSVLQYKTIAPMKRRAENVGDIFKVFQSGLTVTGVYSYDASQSGLKEFGLDKPDFAMTMKIGSVSHTFKFKLQEDGSYAAVCTGEKLIKQVAASNLSFINYSTTDFYSTWVCMEDITSLSAFTFKTANKTYEFSVSSKEKDDEVETTVTYNGKELNYDSFAEFYMECLSLNCTDFSTEKVSSSPEYTMIFTKKDKTIKTYEFFELSGARYAYKENGVYMGKVNSSAINKIEKALKKAVK